MGMFCGLTKKKRSGYRVKETWVHRGNHQLGRSVVLPGERDLGTKRKPPALDGHVLWYYRVKETWVHRENHQPWTGVLWSYRVKVTWALRENHQPWTGMKPTALDWRSVVLLGERNLGTQRKPPALDGSSVVLPGERNLGTQRSPPALDGRSVSYRVKETWVPRGVHQPWTGVLWSYRLRDLVRPQNMPVQGCWFPRGTQVTFTR